MRNLLSGQKPQLYLSPEDYNNRTGLVKVSVAEAGREGDHFFLDENGVPTKVVRGDAAKMKAMVFLDGDKTYPDAFITVAATESDKTELETLAEALNPEGSGSSTPTSDKDGGGCDAGLGLAGLLAVLGLAVVRKKR